MPLRTSARFGRRFGAAPIRTPAGALFFFASYGILMGAFPAELLASGVDPFAIGSVVGSYALGAVLFRVFGLNVVDRVGARRVATIATVASAAATMLFAATMILFERMLPLLVLAKIAHGAAASAFLISGYTYVAQAGPEKHRGRRVGVYGGIGSFGLLVPPPIGIWLWVEGAGPLLWLIPIALVLPAFLMLPGDQRTRDTQRPSDPKDRLAILLTGHAVVIPAAALAVSAGMQGGFEAHFPLLAEDFDAGHLMALMYFLFGISVVVGRLAGGWLADGFGAIQLFLASLAIQSIAVVLPIVAASPLGLVFSAASFGLGAGILTTSAMALLTVAVPPHRSAAAIGLGGLMKDVGFAVGAAFTGLIMAFGGSLAFLLGGLAAITLTWAAGALAYSKSKI